MIARSWKSGGKDSDALATGLALYALAKSGHEGNPVDRARSYLAESQREDGSWKVPSTKKANKEEPNPISNYWGYGVGCGWFGGEFGSIDSIFARDQSITQAA